MKRCIISLEVAAVFGIVALGVLALAGGAGALAHYSQSWECTARTLMEAGLMLAAMSGLFGGVYVVTEIIRSRHAAMGTEDEE